MNLQGLIFPKCVEYLTVAGVGDCFASDKAPKGLIFTTRDFELPFDGTAESWTDAFDNIENSGKVQFLRDGIVNFEPSGGDLRISQEGYGTGAITGLNTYQEVYTIIDGGLCLYKNLLNLHGKRLRVFVIDSSDTVYMTYKERRPTFNSATESYFQGFDCSVGVTYRKNNGTNVGAIQVTLIYNDFEREFGSVNAFALTRELSYSIPTYIRIVDAFKSNAMQLVLDLFTVCGGKNITDIYKVGSTFIKTDMFKLTSLTTMSTVSLVVATLGPEHLTLVFTSVPSNVPLEFSADLTSLNSDESFRSFGYLAPDVYKTVIKKII